MGLFWCNDAHRAAHTFAWRRCCTPPTSQRVADRSLALLCGGRRAALVAHSPNTAQKRAVIISHRRRHAVRVSTCASVERSPGASERSQDRNQAVRGCRTVRTGRCTISHSRALVRHCAPLAGCCCVLRHVCSLAVNSNSCSARLLLRSHLDTMRQKCTYESRHCAFG